MYNWADKGWCYARMGLLCVFALLAAAETQSERPISEISCKLTEKPCQRPLFPWVTERMKHKG